MSFKSRMPLSFAITITSSPCSRQVEPSGMMTLPPRMMTAMRMPRRSFKSFRGTFRFRVEGATWNSIASALPPAMRYKAFITVPLEFCRPRRKRRISPAVACLGETTDSTPAERAMAV